MARIRMLRGLPGSGKTTEARKIVREDGNSARVNRDDIRAMLFDSVWTGKRESIVVAVEKAIVETLLAYKHVAIVDDTNLTDKHWNMWKSLAEDLEVQITQTTMCVSREECIRRDSLRPKPVGEAVINRMALNAGLIDFGDKPIVIVDVDGTLSDGRGREHHIRGVERKDWKAYYALLHTDEPIQHVVKWVNALAEDHTIVIVSGRPDTYQTETLKWLREVAKVKFDFFFQRAGNDKREDSIIKLEILDKMPVERVVLILDDRPRVVRAWKSRGLFCIPVQGGCDEF